MCDSSFLEMARCPNISGVEISNIENPLNGTKMIGNLISESGGFNG